MMKGMKTMKSGGLVCVVMVAALMLLMSSSSITMTTAQRCTDLGIGVTEVISLVVVVVVVELRERRAEERLDDIVD